MNPVDYSILKNRIDDLLNYEPETVKNYQAYGFSHMRLRWDMLRLTGLMCSYYHYLDDSHIDTALRRIVPPYTD